MPANTSDSTSHPANGPGSPIFIPRYDRTVPVTKLTISLPQELAEVVRRAAEREGTSVSALITKELRRFNLLEEGRAAFADYEAEYAKVPDDGGARVRAWLKRGGVEWPPSRSTPAR